MLLRTMVSMPSAKNQPMTGLVKAMILKEFRQMRRDRRTVALMVGLPLMMLIIFGYAARFDVRVEEAGEGRLALGEGCLAIHDQLPRVSDGRTHSAWKS